MNKTFEEMTVKELKEESKKRGLTLESKGHKFTKPELIERLIKWDAVQADIEAECTKEVESCAECEEAPCENTPKVETKEDGYIVYAKTLEEIEQKYGNRKKQEIYDNELKVGSYVVFVHYVEARNGQIYKKLRTAKVVGINRRIVPTRRTLQCI